MPDELRLSIEKLIYGGDGLAHADADTVFVPYVLPGEEVRANAKSRKKKLVWAELLEVTSPAKERGKARCSHFQKCGGCHYQHIPAEEQLRLKKEILRETLSRLGGITWDRTIVEHSAVSYGYRNRAQWAVRSGMPRALGYFLPESSVIVPIDECPVLSPRLARTFAKLQDMARSSTLPPGIQEIEAFADSADEKIALNVAFEKFSKPAAELAGVTIVSDNEHAEEFLKKTEERPDFVILDPPRAGLGAEAAGKLAELGAKKIVYLSCDLSTLARDLAVLTSSPRKPKELIGPSVRYEIAEMHLFDLFPQTFHIETLVRLRRAP